MKAISKKAAETRQNYVSSAKNVIETQLLQQGNGEISIDLVNIPVEEAVLGACIMDKDAFRDILEIIKSKEVFYSAKHQIIFETLFDVSCIDLLTVTEALRKKGVLDDVGGIEGVAILARRVGSSYHLEAHSRILLELYIRRSLYFFNTKLNNLLFDGIDAFEAIGEIENNLLHISEQLSNGSNVTSLLDGINISLDRLQNTDQPEGVCTGIYSLDNKLGIMEFGDLVIVAGRPGMGKTDFSIRLMINMMLQPDNTILYFSAEMKQEQFSRRVLAQMTSIYKSKLKNKELSNIDWDLIWKAADTIQKFDQNVVFDFNDADAPSNIKRLAARHRRKHSNKKMIIFIDYIQLINCTKLSGNDADAVKYFSNMLKQLAKELNCVVIGLSQINREGEKANRGRPSLGNLAGSTGIECDASQVMLMYRPSYYGIEHDENGLSTKDICEIIIAKNREGDTGSVNLEYNQSIGIFSDIKNLFDPIHDFRPFEKPLETEVPF